MLESPHNPPSRQIDSLRSLLLPSTMGYSSSLDAKEAPSASDRKDQTWIGDEKVSSWPRDGDKRALADEELARKLQDDWNNGVSTPSSSTLKMPPTGDDDRRAPYASPPGLPSSSSERRQQSPGYSGRSPPDHTNPVTEAGKMRAINEVSVNKTTASG